MFARQILILSRLEWRRRTVFFLSAIAFTCAGWTVALSLRPELRDGEHSLEVILLVSALFSSMLAADMFARDTGAGRLEFLYSAGASPRALFTARALVAALFTITFPATLVFVEWLRIEFTCGGSPSPRWSHSELQLLSKSPREVFLLNIIPAVALFLFVSSISSRTRTALTAGAIIVTLIVAGDIFANRGAEAPERQEIFSAAWTIITIPATLALGAIAVMVRKFEPERSRTRFALLASAVAILAIRFIMMSGAGKPDRIEECKVSAVTVSPDHNKIAIESRSSWRPDPWMLSLGGAVGRPLEDKDYFFGSRVAISKNRSEASSPITVTPIQLERNSSHPLWISNRHVRVRGVDPVSYELSGDQEPKSLLFDADCRRLTAAPTVYLPPASGALDSQQLWTVDSEAGSGRALAKSWNHPDKQIEENDRGELELFRFTDGSRLIISGCSRVSRIDSKGNETRLWPSVNCQPAVGIQ